MDIEINVTPRKIERIIFICIIAVLLVIIILQYTNRTCNNTDASLVDDKSVNQDAGSDITNDQPSTDSNKSETPTEDEPKEDQNETTTTPPVTPPADTAAKCTPKFKCVDDYHTAWINADCTIDRKKGKSCLDGCKDGECLEG